MPRAGVVSTVAAILTVAAARAVALDPGLATTQYVQTVYRSPAFLPHDDVASVLQTRDGYLWVGTVEGLARFDGVRSVVFDKSNTPAFANNWVRALAEDRAGRLWIGTFGGGLVCKDGDRFVRYGAAEGLPFDIVDALAVDARDRVWVGTLGGGLLRLEKNRFVRAGGTEELAKLTVRSLLASRDGALWIGTETGLYRLDDAGVTRLSHADGLTDDTVLALAEDKGGLWIGTEKGGLDRLVAGRVSAITRKDGLTHDRVWSLAVDRDDNLWIGTDGGGLNRLAHGRLTAFTTKNGLTNDYVWAIREDREGGLWIGTNGGGLNRLKNGRVVCLTTREGLPSDFIWAVVRSRDGSLLVGTEDAGVARVKDGRVTTLVSRAALGGSARPILERRDGSLWIGGFFGLHVLRGGRLRTVTVPGVPLGDVRALAEDAAGALWIGSSTAGLVRLGDGPSPALTRAQGLSGNPAGPLLAARDGSLWAGVTDGINQIVGGRVVRKITKADGLPSDYVTSLFEGPGGEIWVGTRGGLVRVRDDQVSSVTSRDGLVDDAVMSAILGDDGGIWTGTNRGLFRSPQAEVEDVMEGRREKFGSIAFGLDDGLRSVEVNAGGAGKWKDTDGRLWFATRGGLASVLPGTLARNTLPPPVVIEDVLVDGRALPGRGPWRLRAGAWRLDVHVTALSLLAPTANRLRHRLEGWDADWITSDADRTAHYSNLPYGRYRFRAIAANADGVWNEAGASVDFEIEPRLRETIWFRALAFAVFVLAGPLFYLVRVRRLRGQTDRLERLVAERTAEVQAANARLAQLAREDALTGLANRRSFDETLAAEWRRASRAKSPLSLLVVDVDHFKAYNDRFGHQSGDACLKSVALAIAESGQRAGELAARYGGEEFAVLLPAVPIAAAGAAAEALRVRVRALALEHPDSPVGAVTVSVGIASAEPASGGSPEDLVGAADRALYRAKQEGRNRVVADDAARPS